jgi:Crinkler effector protein N-terminal domain
MALPPMPTEHLPRMIMLCCCILGVSLTACPVYIEDSETVGDPFRVIATELLDQSQVSKLTLWMVSSFLKVATNACPQLFCRVFVADQDNFNDEIFRRSLTSNRVAVHKHIFPSPEPAEGTIHIVIKLPPARECG